MKSVLQLYASDSTELISRYLWERHRDQVSIKPGDYNLGSITIRCQLLREHLRIEILNARHLKPPDPISGIFESSNLIFYYNLYIYLHIYHHNCIALISYITARIGDQGRLITKTNSRMLNSSSNLSRSSRNLKWVKSKFKSLRSNLHEVIRYLS